MLSNPGKPNPDVFVYSFIYAISLVFSLCKYFSGGKKLWIYVFTIVSACMVVIMLQNPNYEYYASTIWLTVIVMVDA